MQQYARAFHYQSLFLVLACAALFAAFTVIPVQAFALEATTQTVQLLPPNQGNNCALPSVSEVTPYIYNGSLDSFEFTISDSSYVALAAQVGNTTVPFNFITRSVDASGVLHIHVDMNSMRIGGATPIKVTMLSASSNIVCAAMVMTTVGSGPVVSYPPAPTTSYPTPSNPAHPTPNNPVTVVPSTPTPSTSATTVPATGGSIANICSSQTGAYRLWLILLVVYALAVGGLLWAEFPMSWTWAKTPERVASAILVVLVLLLGFWYFAVPCRAELWMPLLAFLIAILGLLAAFWNHPKVTGLLMLDQKKDVISLPPKK